MTNSEFGASWGWAAGCLLQRFRGVTNSLKEGCSVPSSKLASGGGRRQQERRQRGRKRTGRHAVRAVLWRAALGRWSLPHPGANAVPACACSAQGPWGTACCWRGHRSCWRKLDWARQQPLRAARAPARALPEGATPLLTYPDSLVTLPSFQGVLRGNLQAARQLRVCKTRSGAAWGQP